MIKLSTIAEVRVSRRDLENVAFMEGVKIAVRDKRAGVRKDMSNISGDVARGYMAIMDYRDMGGDSWWDRFNDKLTKWIAGVGTSFFTKRE